MKRLLPIILLLSGCVAISPNLEERVDPITDAIYYEVTIDWTYPKKQFMTDEEWIEYKTLPDSQKETLYQYYKEREEIEERWDNFIENCILRFTLDC